MATKFSIAVHGTNNKSVLRPRDLIKSPSMLSSYTHSAYVKTL